MNIRLADMKSLSSDLVIWSFIQMKRKLFFCHMKNELAKILLFEFAIKYLQGIKKWSLSLPNAAPLSLFSQAFFESLRVLGVAAKAAVSTANTFSFI